MLKGYSLAFRKISEDGSGKCDVFEASHETMVYGVVFSIANNERSALDDAEGYGHGYDRTSIRIFLTDGTPKDCVYYYATSIDETLLPYDWYHALVIAGAEQHNLPEDYSAGLTTQITTPDLKLDRRTRLEALKALEEYNRTKTGTP